MYQPTEEDEREWQESRIGYFSASELHLLVSRSGKFTETNLNYLYKIQRQRYLNQPAPPVYSRTMSKGNEQEPYAISWYRENTSKEVLHFGYDCPKLFKKCDWGKFGASPDGVIIDENALLETKCVIGDKETNWYFSPTVPYESKKTKVIDEHGDQLAGQFIAFPDIDKIYLLKYDPQEDDDAFDLRSPLDPSRGIVFEFNRNEFNCIGYMKRIEFSDKYLESGLDLEKINDYELINGVITLKQKEDGKGIDVGATSTRSRKPKKAS